jgi:hypothetical protein
MWLSTRWMPLVAKDDFMAKQTGFAWQCGHYHWNNADCIAKLAADQRQERVGSSKVKVGVNSIAVMPLNPHLFATGGSDVLGELTQHCPLLVHKGRPFASLAVYLLFMQHRESRPLARAQA